MVMRDWAERQFWARAAFTLTFFIVAVILYVHYRILYGELLFEGAPFMSITVPALIIALMVAWGVRRAM